MTKTKDWWADFHNLETATLFLQRPTEVQEKLTSFLKRHLKLTTNQIVFDQCCGIGTVTQPLEEQNIKVVGVDICEEYIDYANEKSMLQGSESQYFCEDAFQFIPTEKCDAAINWYSSFGYADTDVQNIKMFQCVADSLKSGGYFALDFLNVAGVLNDFKSCMMRKNEEAETMIVRDCWLDLENGRLEQDWHYFGKINQVKHSSVKLYLPHQLKEMLVQCGFENFQFFGDLDDSPLKIDSPRCIIIAQKK